MKKSFILYNDQESILDELSDEECGVLFRALFDFANGRMQELQSRFKGDQGRVLRTAFASFKGAMLRDLEKYERIVKRNRINGLLGGRPPKEPKKPSGLSGNPKNPKNPSEPKKADSDSDSDSDSETYITHKKRKLMGKRLDAFNQFWEAFNYRKGKAEAADAWFDIPTLTDPIVKTIIEAAEREAAGRAKLISEGRTPKMAQGWINGRRWEDEPLREIIPKREPPKPHDPEMYAKFKELANLKAVK